MHLEYDLQYLKIDIEWQSNENAVDPIGLPQTKRANPMANDVVPVVMGNGLPTQILDFDCHDLPPAPAIAAASEDDTNRFSPKVAGLVPNLCLTGFDQIVIQFRYPAELQAKTEQHGSRTAPFSYYRLASVSGTGFSMLAIRSNGSADMAVLIADFVQA